jgi:hypothetical protein
MFHQQKHHGRNDNATDGKRFTSKVNTYGVEVPEPRVAAVPASNPISAIPRSAGDALPLPSGRGHDSDYRQEVMAEIASRDQEHPRRPTCHTFFNRSSADSRRSIERPSAAIYGHSLKPPEDDLFGTIHFSLGSPF